MEERKLIRLGNSSFAIALPKDWIDKAGLKKGDKVYILPDQNGGLLIGTDYKDSENKKEVSLDLNEMNETALQIELIGAYFRDCDILKIKNNLPEKNKKHIKELVKNLMSFEIMEENSEGLTFKDVFNLKESEIKSFIRRADNLLRGSFEELSQGLKSGKISESSNEEIWMVDKEITKLYFLVGRVFMKSLNNPTILSSLNLNSQEIFRDWWTTLHLERLGDNLKTISKLLTKNQKIEKDIQTLFNSVFENYGECITAYHKNDQDLLKKVIQENVALRKECELIETKSEYAAKITENIRGIQDNIFQIAKMMSYISK